MSRRRDRLALATRGSRLALTQAETIRGLIETAHPSVTVELLAVTTRGDRDGRPFRSIPGKGLFTSEVERAVVEGRADAGVHSAKDLTAELDEGLALVCVPARAVAHDVVIGGRGESGEERLASLGPDAEVGTSSMRRRALLAEKNPSLRAVELRGNLDSRVDKVARGEVAVAVLAAAGLERLGMLGDAAPLDPNWWVPCPAQGALAIEGRADDEWLRELLAPLEDAAARTEVTCERAFGARLEGGCSVPLGCLARITQGAVVATGFLGHPELGRGLRDRASGPATQARAVGAELAEAILAAGGDEILAELEDASYPEVAEP